MPAFRAHTQHHHHGAAAKNATHQVYAPGFTHVVNLDARDIMQMPPAGMNVTRLVLCANYDAARPDTSCAMGSRCKFVHADTRRAQKHAIHVNYAWRKVEAVTYERMAGGQTLEVAPPNSKVATDVMDSSMVLKTKALQSKRRPLSHCAHYYFNRACNLGAECQFVHAVFIDPTAKDHQRAPVPSQLGEGRELQLSKKQREMRQREARDALSSATGTSRTSYNASTGVSGAFGRSPSAASLDAPLSGADSAGHHTPRSETSSRAALPSPSNGSVASSSSSPKPAAGRGPVARFRHDPYSTASSRVITFA